MAVWDGRREGSSFGGRRARERARRRRIIRAGIFAILCGAVLAGVWYGTRIRAFTITDVAAEGGETIDLSAVRQEAQHILDGSYFFLVPKRFTYTYPHDEIVSALMRMPRVKDAAVARVSDTAISVTLTEHVPSVLWCPAESASAGCMFVSADGRAFAEAPPLEGTVFLRYVTEERAPEKDAVLASAEEFRETKEFSDALLARHGMRAYAVTETREGDVRYHVLGGGDLIVPRSANRDEIFGNLEAILTSEEFEHLVRGEFDYIDLRFGSEVFVKEAKAQIVPEEAATSSEPVMVETGH